ncbi:hypothetical protein Acr_17g0013970 [Actinidia rufa]|uniref:CCHC-type domain-containing protein n=1 Tax=Actinidia rufa TaxID=165716 RepID=A0A7J0G4V6_9ERIC|nr:hypothetical protein Acr_17g0013970 [Actinidia rufa]
MPPSRVARHGTTARGGRNARRAKCGTTGTPTTANFVATLTAHMVQAPRANTLNRAMEVVRGFRKLNPPMFDGAATTIVNAPTGSFGGVSGNYGNQNKKRQRESLQFSRNRSTFRAPTSFGFGGNSSSPPMTCHQCGQPGHIRTHCPNLKTLPPPPSRVQGALVACFGCGGFGHVAKFCPQRGGTRSEFGSVQQSRPSYGFGKPPQSGAHTQTLPPDYFGSGLTD